MTPCPYCASTLGCYTITDKCYATDKCKKCDYVMKKTVARYES